MDKIIIEALKVEVSIGVHAWEKQVRQILQLDMELACDIQCAAASDQILDAVDYVAVVDVVKATVSGRHFQLIETLAEELARQLLQNFPVQEVSLHLRKPGALAQAACVGVQIVRQRKPG